MLVPALQTETSTTRIPKALNKLTSNPKLWAGLNATSRRIPSDRTSYSWLSSVKLKMNKKTIPTPKKSKNSKLSNKRPPKTAKL